MKYMNLQEHSQDAGEYFARNAEESSRDIAYMDEIIPKTVKEAYRRSRLSSYYSRQAEGTYMYHECIALFREFAKDHGWTLPLKGSDLSTLSATVNDGMKVALIVASGDDNAGTELVASTKNAKGQITERIVPKTVAQLSVFPDETVVSIAEKSSLNALYEGYDIWYLIFKDVRDDNELRFEISLALNAVSGQRVQFRSYQILFDPIDLGGSPTTPTEPTKEIDVEVRRRYNE